MLALIAATAIIVYGIGLRADRLHAQRTVKEPDAIPVSAGSSRTGGRPNTPDQARTASGSSTVRGLYMRHSAGYWNWRYRKAAREVRAVRAKLRATWHPTVDYALRLASAVTGVSYWQLRSVSWCESRHNPFATNGRYRGLFQLSWAPFGMSAFDAVASALSTAMTVQREGWRQWECKP